MHFTRVWKQFSQFLIFWFQFLKAIVTMSTGSDVRDILELEADPRHQPVTRKTLLDDKKVSLFWFLTFFVTR